MSVESITKAISQLEFYKQYPILKPFIGKNYNQILFAGESHFLPESFNPGITWYSNRLNDYGFTEKQKRNLNTKAIIEEDVIRSAHKNNSHSIYRNYGNVYGEVFNKGDYRTALNDTAFYNYFLRPAETPGKSIHTCWNERIFSYNHLITLDKILKPKIIIFLSSSAFKAFHQVYYSKEGHLVNKHFKNKIFVTQHPASSWWNKPSKKNNGRTGKEHLAFILKHHSNLM